MRRIRWRASNLHSLALSCSVAAPMGRASLKTKITAACLATLLASAAAYGVWSAYGGPKSTEKVKALPGSEQDEPFPGKSGYAVDPVVGIRRLRSTVAEMPMVALDGTDPQMSAKHRDEHGFLRQKPLPPLADAARVLVVGDSHVDGVVSTADNLTSLLEETATRKGTPTAFLNVGCGFYSVWQSVLRVCDLIPRYQPKAVVVVVFLGNDFLDLENRGMPHLDDELQPQPAAKDLPPETTSARRRRLGMIEQYRLLFWQGLNQAMYLMDHPERLAALQEKTGYAIDHMHEVAKANDVRVLWALLPSFDLVFPEHAKGLGDGAKDVIESGAQRRMRDAFVAELQKRDAKVVDLELAFRADGRAGTLYAKDFHIFRDGHRVAAEALGPAVDTLLGR